MFEEEITLAIQDAIDDFEITEPPVAPFTEAEIDAAVDVLGPPRISLQERRRNKFTRSVTDLKGMVSKWLLY